MVAQARSAAYDINMTNETPEVHPVTAMVERAERAYKGEAMVRKAVYRALGLGPESVCDLEEACALIIEAGWTWRDVLDANS